MFTGIVQEIASVVSLQRQGQIHQLGVRCLLADCGDKIGDSISINGVCLTITRVRGEIFQFDLSKETTSTTSLGWLKAGDRVNLERALRLSDRLGGHLVSGHVDALGRVCGKKTEDQHYLLGIEFPAHLSCYVVEKGPIAVDGVSLTIASLEREMFWVSIIPHTAEVTTLSGKKEGDWVNLETDLLAKYIYRLLANYQPGSKEGKRASSGLDEEFLAKHGFLSTGGEY